MKKVLLATWALRDRYIVTIEWVYTESTFFIIKKNVKLCFGGICIYSTIYKCQQKAIIIFKQWIIHPLSFFLHPGLMFYLIANWLNLVGKCKLYIIISSRTIKKTHINISFINSLSYSAYLMGNQIFFKSPYWDFFKLQFNLKRKCKILL